MNNDGKKTWNYQVAGIIGLSCLVVLAWGTALLYLAIFKAPTWNNYPIEKLGQVGDFFNIITSLASVITVAFVAYAVILQRKELSAVKEQIEHQTNKLEEDERVNRTIGIIDDWNRVKHQDLEIIPFIEKLILMKENGYEGKIDFPLLRSILKKDKVTLLLAKEKQSTQKLVTHLENQIAHINQNMNPSYEKLTTSFDSIKAASEERKVSAENTAQLAQHKTILRNIDKCSKFLRAG